LGWQARVELDTWMPPNQLKNDAFAKPQRGKNPLSQRARKFALTAFLCCFGLTSAAQDLQIDLSLRSEIVPPPPHREGQTYTRTLIVKHNSPDLFVRAHLFGLPPEPPNVAPFDQVISIGSTCLNVCNFQVIGGVCIGETQFIEPGGEYRCETQFRAGTYAGNPARILTRVVPYVFGNYTDPNFSNNDVQETLGILAPTLQAPMTRLAIFLTAVMVLLTGIWAGRRG
jgi:hypothetical protein